MANRKSRTRSASRTQEGLPLVSKLPWIILVLALMLAGVYIYRHHALLSAAAPIMAISPDQKKIDNKNVTRLKPTFDFYQLLPQIEVPVSTSGSPANTDSLQAKAAPPVKNIEEPSKQRASIPPAGSKQYVLQAAAFKQPADADALKAKLSLMGFEVTVHYYQAADHQEWYQVWIGPYASLEAAQKIQSQLAENQINSLLRQG